MLKEIYSGKVVLGDRQKSKSERHMEIIRKIEDYERYFLSSDKIGDHIKFKVVMSLYTELMAIEESSAFSYGFAMGALMMQDVMEDAAAMNAE